MEIVGYTRPVVAHAGEDVDCMVSTTARNYQARLVRLTRGNGPVITDGLSTPRELTGRPQAYRRGSFLRAQLRELARLVGRRFSPMLGLPDGARGSAMPHSPQRRRWGMGTSSR